MASFEKYRNGTWTVRFRWVNPYGRELNKRLSGYKSKKEATRAYLEFMQQSEANKKLDVPSDDLIFNDLYLKFLEHQKQRIKESSFYDLEHCFNLHILPYFGKKKAIKITKLSILEWQNMLNRAGYSYKYKNNIRNYLFGFFSFLEQYYDIPNMVAKVQNFSKPKIVKTVNVWSYDEFKIFLANSTDYVMKTFFSVLYFTGMRLGEALALAPGDIDLNNFTMTVSKNITRKIENATYSVTSPKNITSYRTIKMPTILVGVIKEYSNRYQVNAEWLFYFGKDKPLAENTVRRAFNAYIAASGLQKIKIHDLRHSHASLLIDIGASIVLVSKRLGHSNTQMTLNTYSHLFPNTENEIVDKLNSLL